MLEAAFLALSPCGVVAFMIWWERHLFADTRRQIRALPEVMDPHRF